MPEGLDISSVACLEDIKSCIARIEQDEVSWPIEVVYRALIRISRFVPSLLQKLYA